MLGTTDTTIGDSFVQIPEWELESGFDPLNVTVRGKPAWLTLKGRVPSLTNLSPRAEEVYHDNVLFDIDSLQLRDPDKFVSGQLHNCVSEWRLILDENAHQDVVKWLEDGVDVGEFFFDVLRETLREEIMTLKYPLEIIFRMQLFVKNTLLLYQKNCAREFQLGASNFWEG
ncbi:Hypothetical predicted protein [Mytilus galloprovincialis]|uniref:Uncharacterized protein n=1 Tax=Mytilus galloprovincialis TaxID=29158 RepID=A0A8B6C4Y2_MYTGA|nr:Hypothetical predicted protein [Mytilus galloprovincialis]